MTADPFRAPSPLPHGYPELDAIREEHFLPAFEAGMAQQRAEVDAITADPAPPTFDNTVVALERSGAVLRRVSAVFSTLVGSCSTPGIREIEAEVAPRLAAHADAISLDPALFARLETISPDRLDEESRRLLERRHRDAVRAGARLGADEQQRLRALNAEISTLSTEFGSRLLAGANAAAVRVDDPARLDGLSPDAVAAVAARGDRLSLVLPTGQPAMASLTDRALREELHTASVTRGALGDENDTREIVRRLVALRAERAALLGHPHHASWVVEVGTAGTVEAIDAMLGELVPVAVENARAEAADLAALAGHDIEPWDRAFYAERLRKERYDLDAAALRPYLELERVLHDGVFFAAHRLYGLTFTERHDLPLHHPDVRVFDVADEDGPLGLFVADLFARDAKRGGAWMNSFVVQSHLLGTRPVVLNTLNIARGVPTLLTIDEVRTLFHEFGHALHGLLSDVRYPTFSGTGVPRDFVEYPSQVNEMWLDDPEVLRNYARHHVTGEPLPAELVERLHAARRFGEGFATTEYLAATLLDLAWHRLGPDDAVDDVQAFEADALRAAGVDVPSAPPRYRSTYFNHVFGGGYSAGYYSYIWSEVLDADTVDWFAENGGLTRANGDAFRRALLSRGGAVDPMEAYRAFRGRDPELRPLLERRGLAGHR
ncbi:M3 family metallopeptidase [Pseudonocardia sp. KRD-184]|uniref:M3 family metallopeptidase n=1 Tax=Pseudonocardia oceani TaxID=2792013 RepID=A0ABS6UA48_9PSEU|nr:M3 family metallopeptidase [Pseudonocardia oceani]MBW0093996.1 M3 family metallopeptidase [Pseudonocardia oceani]MBW0099009.1 M3 family metallopeptidase [Pseudonocardia oceani]MBW0112042.1 M3 family metallopeptidase [Pseudonocardia oceani]MBW0121435.1 M3 family metallopeptidase [Pseudonocardia oceani]MBW0128759.1 M3 family metallopeptidase [Pseudonocardia oceani]